MSVASVPSSPRRNLAPVMPWVSAWQEALYGVRGFYRDPAGPAGHFATSAHGPTGRLFARALVNFAAQHRCSGIVDIGAGRGELLTHLHSLAPHLRLTGMDVVCRPGGLPPSVEWVASPGGAGLPALPKSVGPLLIIANEWLDVVPCPIAEVDATGRLREVEVDGGGRERLGAIAGESRTFTAEDLAWAQRWWPYSDRPGTRVEIGLTRDRALRALVDQLESGVVLAIDYGHLSTDRPRRGSLLGYRRGRAVPPVPDGSCDLTAHVAIDSLPAGRVLSQRAALGELVRPAAAVPYGAARRDPSAYLAALQENSALAELRGAGLGDFWWVITEVPTARDPLT